MAKFVELAREAIAEFNDAIGWYAERSDGAAIGFSLAVDVALERIAQAPDRFPTTYASCRYCSLDRYPFQVVFHEVGDRLVVVAIAHAKRRPGYWQERSSSG